ncbi:MAG: glucose 1-dehydrogenase [Rhizobiales bacterium]|nr:glucose 1-dehydrogenase [Hyphomicrobiales bacterium]MBI3672860.1 glucose 1-dehydrogenase [Hyphomicrobiales bacterium]
MKLFDLTGRVAVITGTSRGIGRELAHGFAEAGAIVVGCARSYERAEKTAAEIRARGHEALALLADVTKPEDCEALIQGAVRRYGRLDILVCNAGVNVKKPAIDFSAAEFDTVIGGNLRAYFLTAQAAARQFIRQGGGGAIVMNSSNASVRAFEDLTPYCAAKGGVDMLVRSLAAEWGPMGIRVNAFNPGYTNHSMTDQGQAYLAEAQREIVARTPLRRVAEMREMVGPAVFLASDAASFVTGTILLADGGWCAL